MPPRYTRKVKQYNHQPIKYVQLKYDGHFAHLSVRSGLFCITGKKSDLTDKVKKIPHLAGLFEILPDMDVLGELYAVGRQATDIPTLLNASSMELRFVAFEYASNETECLPTAMRCLENHGLETATILRIHEGLETVDVEYWTELAREKGWEGVVLKESHHTGWYKVKPVKTVDCFITGVETSFKGNNYGGLGAINIAVFDNGKVVDLGNVGTGFKYEFRMNVDKKSLLGRTCEIMYDSLAANGKLKFPRFIRFRDDEKAKEECRKDQLCI